MLDNNDVVATAISLIERGTYKFTDYLPTSRMQIIDYLVRNNNTNPLSNIRLLNKFLDSCDVPRETLSLQERVSYYKLFIGDKNAT